MVGKLLAQVPSLFPFPISQFSHHETALNDFVLGVKERKGCKALDFFPSTVHKHCHPRSSPELRTGAVSQPSTPPGPVEGTKPAPSKEAPEVSFAERVPVWILKVPQRPLN